MALSVCDYCLDAINEEFPPIDYGDTPAYIDEAELYEVAENWGGDIADHLCEATEEPGVTCLCGCKRHREEED